MLLSKPTLADKEAVVKYIHSKLPVGRYVSTDVTLLDKRVEYFILTDSIHIVRDNCNNIIGSIIYNTTLDLLSDDICVYVNSILVDKNTFTTCMKLFEDYCKAVYKECALFVGMSSGISKALDRLYINNGFTLFNKVYSKQI